MKNKGEKIQDFVLDRKQAESSSALWNRRDKDGNTVPQGMYLYKISGPDTGAGKMIVID